MDALRPAVMPCAWGTSVFAHYFPLFSDDSCIDCVRENKLYFGSDRWQLTPQISNNQQQQNNEKQDLCGGGIIIWAGTFLGRDHEKAVF